MALQDTIYPGYGFTSHVGYGTAMHRTAIENLGVTPLHRLSFAPLAKYRVVTSEQTVAAQQPHKTSKAIGDAGEDAAAIYLQDQGHEIMHRNWKTKFCEIDIVSRQQDVIFFTEVKYRCQPNQGGGLGAITPAKRQQMTFAAELYALKYKLAKSDLRLAVISATGQPAMVETFLEIE
jgi:uncharacterized protein (TIGR00252 family)